MKHHLAEHLTEKGKKKFSRENLIKCETCARLCTKLGYPQHVCFPELVEKKRKTLLGETELDGEKEKSKPAKIICSECGMLVKRQKMKTHMIMAHSEEKPYTCSTCGKSFKLEGTLNKHMKIVHLAERNFHCDQCTKAFTSASSLKFHYMMHTDERRFQCPKCPKKFRKMYNVKVHLEALHGSGLPKFQCPHCLRQLKAKCALTEHIQRVHMKLKSWICSWPDCSEQFYNAKILRRHMCRHTGEKPLSCDYCECAYVQPTELLAHLKSKHNIHTLPLSKRTSFKVRSYERYIFDTDTSGIDGQKMKSIMFQASNATRAHSSPMYNTPATQTCNSPGVNIPTFSANRLAQVDTETKANCSLENSWTSSGSMTLQRVGECSQYANTPNGASYMPVTSVISTSSYVEHNQLVNVPSCSGDETGLYFTPGGSRTVPAESELTPVPDLKPFITDG
ncbi:zinc finger protein 567-like [Mercenaria mercenaria]|uniref:zinc finger protein 567-like n=1 Tax=Mercenaria mercenaria TaxID=6596 RepID=UPI00234EC7BB|nr:zinc finger protein 567-like [Mercenaria mercenaria]